MPDPVYKRTSEPPPRLLCAFCGKHAGEVERLIAGPGAYICSECIELCAEVRDLDGALVVVAEPPSPHAVAVPQRGDHGDPGSEH